VHYTQRAQSLTCVTLSVFGIIRGNNQWRLTNRGKRRLFVSLGSDINENLFSFYWGTRMNAVEMQRGLCKGGRLALTVGDWRSEL